MNDAMTQAVKAPKGYKLTDAGLIPDDWMVMPLGKTCRGIFRGASPRPIADPRWFDDRSAIGWVRISDVTQSHRYLLATTQRLSAEGMRRSRFIPRGSLIMSICATVGRPIETAVDACIHDGFVVFEQPEVDQCFLYYLLRDLEPRWSQKGQTGSQMNLNTNLIKITPIAVPPPEEQQAIADALSDVDGLIGALEKLIAKMRAIKQAAMQQLLTGKTRLPGFTGKWETRRLGDHVSFLRHGTNSRAELRPDGPVKYLHYGDIHANTLAMLEPASLPSLPEEKAKGLDRLRDGDLVFADASEDLTGVSKSVEVCGVGDTELVAGLHTISARFDKEILADGFKAYLQFSPVFSGQLRRLAAGTKVYAMSRSHIASIEMRLPGIDEQRAIAAVFQDMDDEIEALERRWHKSKQIKQGMMQQLLTGRIRLVKLEAQAPPTQGNVDGKTAKSHSWAFNEAVVISTLAMHFGSEQFPLGRKRYTKLSYLLHRHVERQPDGYLKKAAGPYNPRTKYGGPERIALESGYIREHKNGPYTGFVAGDRIAQAKGYFEKWYGPDALQWLDQFRKRRNDDLELLATVDMAAEDLRAAGQAVDVFGVKAMIRSHPEWKAKLDRAVFSDANIVRAIQETSRLFDSSGESAS